MSVVAGCGAGIEDAPSLYQVSGKVTFNGAPIVEGDIVFIPTTGEGRSDGGNISNGVFAFEATGGSKRVEISATREDGIAPDGLPNYVSDIPAKYNTESELEADVTADRENTFTFELKSE